MKSLWPELVAVLLALGFAALAGGSIGGWTGLLVGLALVALLLLVRHLLMLGRLVDWAVDPLGSETPSARGVWGDVFSMLYRRARQLAEQREQLGQMLDRFRQAAEAMPDGVILLDRRLVIEWMNARAERLLGLDQRQDLGGVLTQRVREPEFTAWLAGGHREGPLTLIGPRQTDYTLQFQLAPFAVGRRLLLIRDISQLHRLETMRRDFVANVSHELRTPLTVVSGFLETVADGIDDLPREELTRYLGMAREQADRMRQLIEDLLTLAALESDGGGQEEMIDMEELLDDILSETRALSAGRHGVSLENTGPHCVLGCWKELRSAFANLASNAVRYTPVGGAITLRWRWSGDAAVFSIVDTGIGIEARHISRLTERFYRVDRGRSRASGGTGLGLAIVKHVLERHQARLEIESRPGQGSTFSAVLPARRLSNETPCRAC